MYIFGRNFTAGGSDHLRIKHTSRVNKDVHTTAHDMLWCMIFERSGKIVEDDQLRQSMKKATKMCLVDAAGVVFKFL